MRPEIIVNIAVTIGATALAAADSLIVISCGYFLFDPLSSPGFHFFVILFFVFFLAGGFRQLGKETLATRQTRPFRRVSRPRRGRRRRYQAKELRIAGAFAVRLVRTPGRRRRHVGHVRAEYTLELVPCARHRHRALQRGAFVKAVATAAADGIAIAQNARSRSPSERGKQYGGLRAPRPRSRLVFEVRRKRRSERRRRNGEGAGFRRDGKDKLLGARRAANEAAHAAVPLERLVSVVGHGILAG
jgi:hypothetical protein